MRYVCCICCAMAMSLTSWSSDIFQIIQEKDLAALSSVTTDVAAVNSVDKSGDTPLMMAARMGDVKMVKMLLAAGANVDAQNNGATVKEQIEGYLRRTGDSRKEIVLVLNELGIDPRTIDAFQKESDALEGSPSRRQNWKEILGLLQNQVQRLSDCDDDSKGEAGRTYHSRSSLIRSKLKMSDFDRVFSMITAMSNSLQLVVRDSDQGYFAVLDNKKAMNICGGEIVDIPVGGSLKLVGENFIIMFSRPNDKPLEGSVLWGFDVEFKFVNKGDKRDEIMIKTGTITARKGESSEIVIKVY